MHERPQTNEPAHRIEAYRDALFQSGAVKIAKDAQSRFRLKSGGESWVYVDHGDVLCEPETNIPYINAMASYIQSIAPQESTLLVNVGSKSSPQTTGAIATEAEYRQIAVISEEIKQAEKGTQRRLRMPRNLGKVDTVVIVDDVLTTGTTAIETAELVKGELTQRLGEEAAGNVNYHLVVGLARNPEKAAQTLQQQGITSHWLTDLNGVVTRAWPTLTREQKAGIREELPNFAGFMW